MQCDYYLKLFRCILQRVVALLSRAYFHNVFNIIYKYLAVAYRGVWFDGNPAWNCSCKIRTCQKVRCKNRHGELGSEKVLPGSYHGSSTL